MSIKSVEKKVLQGRRLSVRDALDLFHSDDIFTIGRLANTVAEKKNGRKAYFIQNHHVNPTNICVNRCAFCAFSRSKGEKGAYELSIGEIIDKLRENMPAGKRPYPSFEKGRRGGGGTALRSTQSGPSEVHIVGGLHPDWTFDYYVQMVREIKKHFPSIQIKAFTAVEIDHFSRISRLRLSEILQILKNAGLDSLPGGGAEIFNPGVRNRICPEKISGKRWLEVMEEAHSAGIRSNATMLYGHYEAYKHRVEHMAKLRALQDRTGGFQAFIPLSFHPKNTGMSETVRSGGIDDIRTIAVSRLFLDNFPHIKAYWIMLGEKVAQLSLIFGADDLDGTIVEERITHSAGALSGKAMTRADLVHLIEKAGKVPVERDSFYRQTSGAAFDG